VDSLIYQDNTHKDIWLKVVLAIPLVLILVPALYSLASNNTETAMGMFGVVVFILVVFWIIIPRQYLILDNKVKIVFVRPFVFNIPFNTIKTARIAKTTSFGVNFPSSLSSKHAVEIVRKKRMGVIITPENRELFLENLDKAVNEWQQRHGRGTQ
jgi:hypothetical protein